MSYFVFCIFWIGKAVVMKTVPVKNCFKTNRQSYETIIQFQTNMFSEGTNTNRTDASEKRHNNAN